MSNNIPSLNQEYTREMFRRRPTSLRGAEGVKSSASRWKLATKSIQSKYTKFQVCIIECTVEAEIAHTNKSFTYTRK